MATKKTATKKTAAKKTAAKRPPAKAPSRRKAQADAEPEVPEIVGSQQDCERFSPAARALDVRDVKPFRGDPSLAYHNVAEGVEAVLERKEQVRDELPTADLDAIEALPNVALAVCFAASQVDRGAVPASEINARLARARELRDLLLSGAVALKKAKVLPARAVEKIEAGRGAIDAAQDLVDLAALYTGNAAALRGKTVISAAEIREAAALGTELLTMLRPKSARRTRKAPAEVVNAVELRDRLGTLLIQGHDRLRRVGMWLWGEEVSDHVPLLQSRVVNRKKKKPAASGQDAQAAVEG